MLKYLRIRVCSWIGYRVDLKKKKKGRFVEVVNGGEFGLRV